MATQPAATGVTQYPGLPIYNQAPAAPLIQGSGTTAGTITAPVSTPAAKTTARTTAAATPALTAAQIAANQATADFNSNKTSILGSINNGIDTSAGDYHNSILDYLDSQKQAQAGIDSESVQNELAREQGMQSITDMVGNGIKGGGVILANDGAGSSSAGDALAKAYGLIGRQQASGVGNQFAQGQDKVNTDQGNLVTSGATKVRDINQAKADTINTIVNNATTALGQLNQNAAYASIPERVQIDQQIATIKSQAMAALSAYDSELSSSATPESQDAVRAKAASLLSAGTAPASQFNYTSDVPASLNNTGQFASSLPIFLAPNKKTNT